MRSTFTKFTTLRGPVNCEQERRTLTLPHTPLFKNDKTNRTRKPREMYRN